MDVVVDSLLRDSGNLSLDTRWYALSVRSRFEKKSDTELQRKGIESFLPLVEEVHLWSDRKRKVKEPLFRGYVFVKTDLRNKLAILQTDGVVRFVGVRNLPSPIPDNEMNWMRILGNHPNAVVREEYVSVGEVVRIVAGPFRGIEGFISQVKDSARVVVSFSSIAQSVSVEVASAFIERSAQPLHVG
jgi:transcription antitermination factor NusG